MCGLLTSTNTPTYSICAFYMTLTQGASQYPPESGGAKGLSVFNALVAAAKRNITVRVVIGVCNLFTFVSLH